MTNTESNSQMATPSQTTASSTGGSTTDSTGSSSRRSNKWERWTKQEVLKISKPEVRDAIYLASRHGKLDEFISKHFPNRTKKALWSKVWQIEARKEKFCSKCGNKIL